MNVGSLVPAQLLACRVTPTRPPSASPWNPNHPNRPSNRGSILPAMSRLTSRMKGQHFRHFLQLFSRAIRTGRSRPFSLSRGDLGDWLGTCLYLTKAKRIPWVRRGMMDVKSPPRSLALGRMGRSGQSSRYVLRLDDFERFESIPALKFAGDQEWH